VSKLRDNLKFCVNYSFKYKAFKLSNTKSDKLIPESLTALNQPEIDLKSVEMSEIT